MSTDAEGQTNIFKVYLRFSNVSITIYTWESSYFEITDVHLNFIYTHRL